MEDEERDEYIQTFCIPPTFAIPVQECGLRRGLFYSPCIFRALRLDVVIRHSVRRLTSSTKQRVSTSELEPRPQHVPKISKQIRYSLSLFILQVLPHL